MKRTRKRKNARGCKRWEIAWTLINYIALSDYVHGQPYYHKLLTAAEPLCRSFRVYDMTWQRVQKRMKDFFRNVPGPVLQSSFVSTTLASVSDIELDQAVQD